MSNSYIGYHFTIEPKELGSEILIAELGEKAFESFTETETGIDAFVQKELWDDTILDDVYILQSEEFTIDYTYEEIEQINWNEEWEKNFEPIEVDGKCHVRAPFHPKTEAEFDIVIEPKMSFGTGHHETTHMMIQHLLEMDVKGLKTLDMGCGTAILAILAEMKGAQPIDAIDIDNWCYLNSIENAERNNCQHISVYEGDAALLKDKKYDLIIANINRNILLNDMQSYVDCLNPGGTILFSGFYEEDIPFIDRSCTEKGLTYIKKVPKKQLGFLKICKLVLELPKYKNYPQMSTKEKVRERVSFKEATTVNNEIVVYNDDVNTFDHVIDTLVRVCDHTPEQAEQCSLIIHYNGKCTVKTDVYDKLKPQCIQLLEAGLSAEII